MDALPTDRSILRELLARGATIFCLNRFSACITGCADGLLPVQAAAALEIPLLLSCRAGSCFSWAGTLIMASVHQEDQASLDEDRIVAAFVASSVAVPASALMRNTHAEQVLP